MAETFDDTVFMNVVPRNHEVEARVLGALMQFPSILGEYADQIKPELFHLEEHILIAEAIRDMYADGSKIDIATITNHLRKAGKLTEAGGPYLISQLTNDVTRPGNIEVHLRILQEHAMRRMMIDLAVQSAKFNFSDEQDVFDSIEFLEKGLMSIHNIIDAGQSVELAPIVDRVLTNANTAKENSDNNMMSGLPTPFDRFNLETGGLQNSDMIVVAARPAMGKTTFVLNIADYISNIMDNPQPGVFFSLEMSAEQLVQKIIGKEAKVSTLAMRKGNIQDDQINRMFEYGTKLKKKGKMLIDDRAALSVYQFKAALRRYKQRYDIKWAVIDYLQLMTAKGGKGQNREGEIRAISGAIKEMAKELNIPIIALSQLSRAVEQRGGDKRPQLSDLRESGSIEQDADLVMMLYRPEYYGFDEDADGQSTLNILEGIIAKNRHGGTFDYRMEVDLAHSLVKNADGNAWDFNSPPASFPTHDDVPWKETEEDGSRKT